MGSTLEEFRAAFEGEALLPADAGYDAARDVWNGDVDRRPVLIARCGTPAHVARPSPWHVARASNSRSAAAGTTSPARPCATTAS